MQVFGRTDESGCDPSAVRFGACCGPCAVPRPTNQRKMSCEAQRFRGSSPLFARLRRQKVSGRSVKVGFPKPFFGVLRSLCGPKLRHVPRGWWPFWARDGAGHNPLDPLQHAARAVASKRLRHRDRAALEGGVSERPDDCPTELGGRGVLADAHPRATGDDASSVVGLVAAVGHTDERHAIGEGRVDRLPTGVRDDERGVRNTVRCGT